MILIRNDIMVRVRYVHDTDTYINVSDTCALCCDTLHDTHYIIINPNYYKYVSFYIMFVFGTRYDFDTYIGDTSTHAQGTDPKVALGA